MRLILEGHDYRYALEQTVVALFGEKAGAEDGDEIVSSLSFGQRYATASATIRYRGSEARSFARADIRGADESERTRLCTHALKIAAFKAAREVTGRSYRWGALTGVRPAKLFARFLDSGISPHEASRLMEDRYFVSPDRVKLAEAAAIFGQKVKNSRKPGKLSVYVGIPFCPSRCSYCSFVSSEIGRASALVEPYIDALCSELEIKGNTLRELGIQVDTVYMGGGTPTSLSAEQLERVMDRIESTLPVDRLEEYTVEAGRPDTVTEEKLRVIKRHGAGRISINPQSMMGKVLELCGRPHTPEDVIEAYEIARRVGFGCINMDTIAGLPGDSPDGFAHTIEEVLRLNPENITVHTLALKRGSDIKSGEASAGNIPAPENVERMLDFAFPALYNKGYNPYYLYRQKYMAASLENTGWAKPGSEGIYNVCIMEEFQTILSFGAGAVTKLVDGARIKRLSNSKYPREYIADREKIEKDNIKLSEFLLQISGKI